MDSRPRPPLGSGPSWHPGCEHALDSVYLNTFANVGSYWGMQSVLTGSDRQLGFPAGAPPHPTVKPAIARERRSAKGRSGKGITGSCPQGSDLGGQADESACPPGERLASEGGLR